MCPSFDEEIQSRCLLIIEDDDAIRETLRTVLELEGYSVLSAENGRQGLEVLMQNGRNGRSPCLILLDLMMPVMNGWEFMAALKRSDGFASVPILVLTAVSERARIKEYPVMKKPVDLDLLMTAIKSYCA